MNTEAETSMATGTSEAREKSPMAAETQTGHCSVGLLLCRVESESLPSALTVSRPLAVQICSRPSEPSGAPARVSGPAMVAAIAAIWAVLKKICASMAINAAKTRICLKTPSVTLYPNPAPDTCPSP